MTIFSDSGDTRLHVETISNDGAAWILIHGEVDIANVQHLEAALAGIQLNDTKSVHIDASGLDFFDVTALRRLTDFAQLVKRTGRDVCTCRATPMLREVARILDFHEDLGLS